MKNQVCRDKEATKGPKEALPETEVVDTDAELSGDGPCRADYSIEAGARTFAACSKALVDDLGNAVRSHFRSRYECARDYPGFDNEACPRPRK